MRDLRLRRAAGLQTLLYCLITGLLIYAWDFLPARKLLIYPSADHHSHYVYTDNLPDGRPIGGWVDERNYEWQCEVPADGKGHMCGFNVLLGLEEFSEGIDLSHYEEVHVDLTYRGEDPRLRFYIRNYEPGFSNINDMQTSKFNNVHISTRFINDKLVLSLSEMFVAEWWITDFQVPREKSKPDFRHAQAFGVDLSYPGTAGKHEFKLNRLEFVGYWIPKEQWYLGIMLMWILALLVYSAIKFIRLVRQMHQEKQQIDHLAKENDLLAEQSKKYKKLSTIDHLTGLLNRHGVTEYLDQRKSDDRQMAMLVIDIDFFKKINDSFGHDVGDQVLRKISAIIRSHLRPEDQAGRWGGEEFVIILPDTDADAAYQYAENLRLAVAREKMPPNDKESVTISLGVGATSGLLPFHQLFRHVDLALYRAKASGRNCSKMAEIITS